MDRNIPTMYHYLVLETKRVEMWRETGRRAVKYEEKRRFREDKEVIWKYIREMNERKQQ